MGLKLTWWVGNRGDQVVTKVVSRGDKSEMWQAGERGTEEPSMQSGAGEGQGSWGWPPGPPTDQHPLVCAGQAAPRNFLLTPSVLLRPTLPEPAERMKTLEVESLTLQETGSVLNHTFQMDWEGWSVCST